MPLPPFFLLWLLLILIADVVSAELVKGWFYRHHLEQNERRDGTVCKQQGAHPQSWRKPC